MIVEGITSILVFLVAGAIFLGIMYSVSQNTYKITREALKSLSDSFEILERVKVVGESNNSFIIDYVVMSKKGIYLLKIIDREGIITGDDSQTKWKEELASGVEEFDNPIRNIIKIIKGIRNELGDIAADIPIYPIVVFPKKADLSNSFSDALVIKANEIKKHIKGDEEAITDEQVNRVRERLTLKSQGRSHVA